jgi:hypothetical protein
MKTKSFLLFISFMMLTASAHAQPFVPGEKITYAIKKFTRIGGAELIFNGPEKLEGRDALRLTFTAHSLNFFDEEKIYMDPTTFYPIAVMRDLNVFGSKEQITERYREGKVVITKTSGGKTSTEERSKPGAIDNIYCFIYRYRNAGKFQIGDAFKMNLPTRDVTMRLLKKTAVDAGGRSNDAYYMETMPKQFSVWFDAGDKKIPLRIDGAVGINQAAMIMDKYERPK